MPPWVVEQTKRAYLITWQSMRGQSLLTSSVKPSASRVAPVSFALRLRSELAAVVATCLPVGTNVLEDVERLFQMLRIIVAPQQVWLSWIMSSACGKILTQWAVKRSAIVVEMVQELVVNGAPIVNPCLDPDSRRGVFAKNTALCLLEAK